MTDNYERLRDSAPEEARGPWRDGDRWSSYLQEKDQQLKADESLSEQGKFEKAEGYRANAENKIRSGYEKARKVLTDEAKRKQRASIPLPDDLDLSTTKVSDSAGLLAVQGEAQAIIARVERMHERAPQGLRGDATTDILREVYASAMDDGGVEGVARARGCLKAAEQLGIPQDEVIAPFREQKHYDAADETLRLENLQRQVPSGKSLPTNPFAPERAHGSDFHTSGSRQKFLAGGAGSDEKPIMAGSRAAGLFGSQRRKAPWK